MYELKNQMEPVVRQQLQAMLPELDVCPCEKCQLDILALALNDLPSLYVVTEQGALLTRIDMTLAQNQTNVMVAVTEAALKVSQNPRHG
jgi:competence protein ComFB